MKKYKSISGKKIIQQELKDTREDDNTEVAVPKDRRLKRGVRTMVQSDVNTRGSLFPTEIVGMRKLRANLSNCISRAINDFEVILTANTAVKGSKTVSIISTDMLKMMLDSCVQFNTSIDYDDATKQYVITVPEIDADGQGATKDEAKEVLIDNIIMLTEDYFENVELYLRLDNSKKMLPYFERIRQCENINDMIKVLGLDQI